MADQQQEHGEGSSSRRTTRGRQKMPMLRIENKSSLQVAFSKRRAGLFKKASELCTLCGVEAALIVFSPANKAFSYGHPSVEAVIDTLASTVPEENPVANQLVQPHRDPGLRELNAQLSLSQVTGQVAAERERGQAMKREPHASMVHRWWDTPVELIEDEHKLIQLQRAFLDLKAAIAMRTDRLLNASNVPGPFNNNSCNTSLSLGFGSNDHLISASNVPRPFNNNSCNTSLSLGFGSNDHLINASNVPGPFYNSSSNTSRNLSFQYADHLISAYKSLSNTSGNPGFGSNVPGPSNVPEPFYTPLNPARFESADEGSSSNPGARNNCNMIKFL